jgi:hypothetical protein
MMMYIIRYCNTTTTEEDTVLLLLYTVTSALLLLLVLIILDGLHVCLGEPLVAGQPVPVHQAVIRALAEEVLPQVLQ